MHINYKFHALAIAIISAVIIVIFMLFGPKEQAPVENRPLTTADNYVRVVSATWGKNCNHAIESAMDVQAKEGLERQEDGTAILRPTLKTVALDNVLTRVKEICEGKPLCQISVDSQALGTEPYVDCFKQLELSYRCFEVDRLRNINAGQGKPLTIDCTNPTGSHAPTDTH